MGSPVKSAVLPASMEEQRIVAKVKRYLFVYIFLGQIFYQFDRSNIGFANLTMGKELALNAQAFGFASGIFGLSAFLMQIPAGLAFDKWGPRRWLTAIMVAWGLVVIAEGFVTNAMARNSPYCDSCWVSVKPVSSPAYTS